MPQENGWATGPEHCDNDGRTCPYCGSENTDSGTFDTQAGQVVESGCECLDCGKTWDNLYNIAGWYHTDEDGDDTLHEDLRRMEEAEKLREQVRILREALERVNRECTITPNEDPHLCHDYDSVSAETVIAVRTTLEATKEGA